LGGRKGYLRNVIMRIREHLRGGGKVVDGKRGKN
jgi:hypothetical protein